MGNYTKIVTQGCNKELSKLAPLPVRNRKCGGGPGGDGGGWGGADRSMVGPASGGGSGGAKGGENRLPRGKAAPGAARKLAPVLTNRG